MRFALLGVDPYTLAVARAVSRSSVHELAAVVQPEGAFALAPDVWEELAGAFGEGVRTLGHWEELAAQSDVDAVLVTATAEALPAAMRLAEAGLSLLVSVLGAESFAFHQLAMAAEEHGIRLVAIVPDRLQPAVVALRRGTLEGRPPRPALSPKGGEGKARGSREGREDGELGWVQRVQLAREAAIAGPAREAAHDDPEGLRAFLRQFVGDVDLLHFLMGEVSQVSALAAGPAGGEVASLVINLHGRSGALATWSLVTGAVAEKCELTVAGREAAVRLAAVGSSARWRRAEGRKGGSQRGAAPEGWAADPYAVYRVREGGGVAGGSPLVEGASEWDPGEAVLQVLAAGGDDSAAWNEAARSIELVELAALAVRRRRTIDVYHEEPSEQATFKTKMTSLGCLLLVAALPITLVAAILEAMGLEWQGIRFSYVCFATLPLLAGFLLLQLLGLVFRDGGGSGEGTPPSPPS